MDMMKGTFLFLFCLLQGISAQANEDRFTEAYQLIRAKQYTAGIAMLMPLAEQGHADAQYWLGLSYRLGRPDQDFSDMEAELQWYEKAAKNKNPYALWRLGRGQYLSCQLFQSCEHKNKAYLEKAREIWRQRAEQGDGEAIFNVGIRDLGWKRWIPYYNAYARVEWMKRAINQGYPRAAGELYSVLRDLGDEDDQKEMITWLKIAAEKGDPWAQNMMSKFADSPEERISWNKKSVAQGYSEGIFSLAYSYENGRDREKNLEKAAFYYCILTYNTTARTACEDLGKELTEQARIEISAQVKEWLEHNTVYYFTDPLFD